ncbi:MAG: glycosyltransferase family 4 protein [Acidimicrobiia bacterium]
MIDSLVSGGAESSLAVMTPELVNRGVRLDVVALKQRNGVRRALVDGGATVIELDGDRRTWWRSVARIVRDQRPDLVHTTLFEADLAGRIGARLAHTPVVSTLANESYGVAHRKEYPGRRMRLVGAQAADIATARLTRRLHAVSEHVANVMAGRLRYPRSRIDVIPRGRDERALGRRTEERRERARIQLGIDPSVPLVLAIARQEWAKGLDVLIDTLAPVRHQFPTARYVVAGRAANASDSLHARLRGTDDASAFTFLGARTDVAELLCAADVFVLASRREGLPGALLEAMALECPAVVSDLPQIREVVDESMALLVPPDAVAALETAIRASLADPASARQRAVAARERFVERFTIEPVVDRMVDFYERALER